jgi:hypothetical protein
MNIKNFLPGSGELKITVPLVAYYMLVRGLLKVVLEIVTRDKIRMKYFKMNIKNFSIICS